MRIPRREVRHIAGLARLELTEDQIALFTAQLNSILEYMEKLNEVDTRGIAPTSHVLHIVNAFREDVREESLNKKDAMENAPQKDKDFFSVPKVI